MWSLADLYLNVFPFSWAKFELAIDVFHPLNVWLAMPNYILLKKMSLSTVLRSYRGIELEDKATVVASVWGTEFAQFLAALAVLSGSFWKKRSNSSYFSKSTEAKQLARQGIEQTDTTTFALSSNSILLLCAERQSLFNFSENLMGLCREKVSRFIMWGAGLCLNNRTIFTFLRTGALPEINNPLWFVDD